jgi:hypothetical protein
MKSFQEAMMHSDQMLGWCTAQRVALLVFCAVFSLLLLLMKAELPLASALDAAVAVSGMRPGATPPPCDAANFAGYSLAEPLISFDGRSAGYGPEVALTILCAMTVNGGVGTQAYLNLHFPLDMVFPFFYGSALAVLWLFLLKQFGWPASVLKYLALVPIVAAVLDLAENLSVRMLVVGGPPGDSQLIQFASVLTTAKWCLAASSAVAILGFLFVYLIYGSLRAPVSKSS